MASSDKPQPGTVAYARILNEAREMQEKFEITLKKCHETVEFLLIGNERTYRELNSLKNKLEELKSLSKSMKGKQNV